jgi:transposase-like protein
MTKQQRRPFKIYSDDEKAPILARLAQESLSEVSAATGVGSGTLRIWANAAGIEVPDGRSIRRPSKPPPPTNGHAKPATNGHAKPPEERPLKAATRTIVESTGPRLTVHGLGDYIRQCVRDELPGIVRTEIQTALTRGFKA